MAVSLYELYTVEAAMMTLEIPAPALRSLNVEPLSRPLSAPS